MLNKYIKRNFGGWRCGTSDIVDIRRLMVNLSCRWDLGGQRHAQAALPPGNTLYPLYRSIGGPQRRSVRVQKIFARTGIRSPNRSARSESLYRLSYPCPAVVYTKGIYTLYQER